MRYVKLTNNPNNLYLKWIPGLLTHVYGQETAGKILQQTGLV